MSQTPKRFIAFDDEDNPYEILSRSVPGSTGKAASEEYVWTTTGEVLTILDDGIGIFKIESADVVVVAGSNV